MKLFSLFRQQPKKKKKSIFRLWIIILGIALCFNLSLTFLDQTLQENTSLKANITEIKEDQHEKISEGPIQKAYGAEKAHAVEKAEAEGEDATEEGEKGNPVSKDNEIKKTISEVISIVISVFTPFIAIFTHMIGWLMGNEVVLGTFYSSNSANTSTVPIAQILHATWVIFRDIMNYIFILILLVIAFMNVVKPLYEGISDSYALKTMLPKLIVAIIIVNFTWFGAQVILTASDVAARIVFALPETMTSNAKFITDGEKESCKIENFEIEGKIYKDVKNCTPSRVILQFDKIMKRVEENEKKSEESGPIIMDYGFATVYWEDFDYSKFNKNSVASMYAFNIMKIQNLARSASGNQDWSTLTINILASLVIMIVVLVVFFIMVVALFLRIVVLWVNIILSPFLGLMMFQDVFNISGAVENEDIGMKAFLKNAFLPAMMGIPLSLGFILINTGQSILAKTGLDKFGTPGEMATLEFTGELINGVANIHQVFWYGLAIIFLWASVPIAESSNKLAGAVIGPIKSAAEGFGKFIAQSPMYLNFIPIYQGEGKDPKTASVQNILDVVGNFGNNMLANEQRDNPLNLNKQQTVDQIVNQTFSSRPQFTQEIDAIKARGPTDANNATKIWNAIKGLPNKDDGTIKAELLTHGAQVIGGSNLSGQELKTAVLAIANAAEPTNIVGFDSKNWEDGIRSWN
jgi:hypothetical protein